MSIRAISRVIQGQTTSDGAGVRLKRLIGQPQLPMLDPFLLFDAFGSDQPQEYIGGFPAHPHRGFETVTYLLNGRLKHEDNAGNKGLIEAGGIQWMTAGRGTIHSEMPAQQEGLLQGFQLWINLPASHKMTAVQYQEFNSEQLPIECHDNGVAIKVLAGATPRGTRSPVQQALTEACYLDIRIPPGQQLQQPSKPHHHVFLYLIKGPALIPGRCELQHALQSNELAILGPGEQILIQASDKPVQGLLASAKPLNEAIARRGPFVMNTHQELQQAFEDYKLGRF